MRGSIVLSVAAMALLPACGLDCTRGTGAVERRALEVPAFTGIVLEGAMNVHVTRGDAQAVELEGQSNITALVTTEVRKGVWHITTSGCTSTDSAFVVHIRTPQLERITIEGSGDVTADSVFGGGNTVLTVKGSGDLVARDLRDERVMVSLLGSGDIALYGTAAHLDADVKGSGSIHAAGLSAAHTEVVVQGSGDVEVTAVEDLDATVAGSGNVRYRGSPKLTSRIQGSGTVAPLE